MAHLVSELLELLSSIRFYEVKQEVRLVVGVKEEVKNLTRKLQSVKLEVADAERRWRHAQDQSAKEWLDDFEEICYGLDDVLDEWVTAILKSETESEYENPSKSKRKLKIHSSRFTCGQVSLRDGIASKIKKLNEKANGFFGRKKPDFEKSIQYSATAVDETSVCGREKEKDRIMKLLLGESTDQGGRSSDVISIVGIAGVGKTYLAELVYEEKSIKEEFNFKIWVSVSQSFAKIIAEKSDFQSVPNRFSSSDRVGLNDLLEETALAVFGKKFLLVLDDVQEIDSFMWDKYLKCYFEFGLPGSKVLITTRSDMVPVSMSNHTSLFPLHGITEDDCRSLFSHCAWFGNSSTESEGMVSIHNKIISGCKGLPFLVKALVSLLQVKISTEERQHVLDSKAWDQYKDKPGYPPLLLCYDDLPSKMRRCFAYCAVFSKDCKKLEQEYWINLWMAQGYLRATQIKEEELVGKDYFENLIARSFFQNAIKDGNGSTAACKVHDLVHEFAQFLTENDCVNVEVSSHGVIGMVSSWDKVRHLKIEFSERNASFPVSFASLKNLRSLLVDYCKSDYPIVIGNQDDLLSRLTCLRALKLSHISSEEISDKIGKLIHLRYLDLSDNQHLKYLPEEIGELYNLQTLNLSGCCELQRLPYGLCRLINLRHLNNYHTDKLTFMPRGIERLTSLKSLYKFVVNCSYHSRELSSTLGDLQNLNYLRKYLEISGLGNSTDMISEARKAQLKKKKQLVTLKLSFVECRALIHDQDEEIIQALEPPPSLEHLEIEHYGGIKMKIPNWMMQLAKLSKICISKCRNCNNLPPLGKLPFLEYLEISDMRSVHKVGDEFLGIETNHKENEDKKKAFPKLKELRFSHMYAWDEWDALIALEEEVMPCLLRLYIGFCDKLEALPAQLLQMTTLEELAVDHCGSLGGQYHWNVGVDWHHISHIPIIYFDGKRYVNYKYPACDLAFNFL
jgi:hypothetical protein